MAQKCRKLLFPLAFAAMLPLLATDCHAELGGTVSTIANDQARMLASRRVEAGSAFSRHVITTPAGVQVTEFVAASGTVFAVTWQGPVVPDLRQLLGNSFAAYKDAIRPGTNPRRPISVQGADLVISSGGHARAFSGIAYLPQQLPAGVTVQDIR